MAGMGEFLFHLLSGLENSADNGCRAIPALHECEQHRREFLATPADAIGDRLLFASRLLCRFAVHSGAMTASDTKGLERRIEAALRNIAMID